MKLIHTRNVTKSILKGDSIQTCAASKSELGFSLSLSSYDFHLLHMPNAKCNQENMADCDIPCFPIHGKRCETWMKHAKNIRTSYYTWL